MKPQSTQPTRCNACNELQPLAVGPCQFVTCPYPSESGSSRPGGIVYLLRSGPHYKIGKTNDFKSRLGQIKLQLPLKVEVVHQIETDDPDGIERYWHRRFGDKRLNGEWFRLSDDEVEAFISRRRM
jgi:hypothetical protein